MFPSLMFHSFSVFQLKAYEYPIYGTQWHPEKNPFEWNMHSEKNIPHSGDAVKVSQYMAEFIVSEGEEGYCEE